MKKKKSVLAPNVVITSPLSTCIAVEEDLTVNGTYTFCDIIDVTVNGVTIRATRYSNGNWDAGSFSVIAGTQAQCAAHQAPAKNRVDVRGTLFGIDGEPDLHFDVGRDFWVHRPTHAADKKSKKKK